jgi:hypothetical protein
MWSMAPGKTLKTRRLAIVPVAAIVLVLAVQVVRIPKLAPDQLPVGPIERISATLFGRGEGGLAGAIAQLLYRDGYGPIADRMIEEHPLSGIGVGSYHGLTLDYGPFLGARVPADNAQNWVRHNVAELGAVGALGFVAWVGMLVFALVVRPRGPDTLEARLVSFAIGGFLVASLVGMPTQNPALFAAFMALVFWHAEASGRPAGAPAPARAWSRPGWALVAVVVAIHAGATLVAARNDLRVPNRAARFGWPYERGVNVLEYGETLEFRWMERRATVAIPARGPYLRLTYWVHHPDAEEKPVRVRFRMAGRLIVDELVRDHNPHIVYVRMREGATLEAEVDRTWTPPGDTSGRELGVAVADWRFVQTPPRSEVIVDPWGARRPQ